MVDSTVTFNTLYYMNAKEILKCGRNMVLYKG